MCLDLKLFNSTKSDLNKIIELFIEKHVLNITNLLERYKLNEDKFNNCSMKILNIINENMNYSNEKLISEITNKLIKSEFLEVSNLIKSKSELTKTNLFIINNGELDIYSTARSLRTFIEFISKMFIFDQAIKCWKFKNKSNFHPKIQKLSTILTFNSVQSIFISLNDLNYKNLEYETNFNISEIKKITSILHLDYQLKNFDDQFSFDDNYSFGFTKEIYSNFIKKIIDKINVHTLNIFAHTFPWLNNENMFEIATENFVNGLITLIDLLKSNYYNQFLEQLSTFYSILKNKDNCLEKFFQHED